MPSFPAKPIDAIGARTPRRLALVPLLTAMAVVAMPLAASAQTSSPAIKAEEDSDPAAGEVVIINPSTIKKRKKKTTHNTYEPIKHKPLPDTNKPAQRAAVRKPKTIIPAGTSQSKPVTPKPAAPKTVVRKPESKPPAATTTATAARTEDALPPLPKFNRVSPAQRARLRQFPQPPLNNARSTPARSDSEIARLNDPKRRVERQQRAADRRAARESRRLDRLRARNRRFADRNNDFRRRSRRTRPWRYCRLMAWDCRDGDDEACYLWRQRCR